IRFAPTCPFEDAPQAVIAFMAGIFIQSLGIFRHRKAHGYRRSEPAGVLDCVLVHERVGCRASKALGELERPVDVRAHRPAWTKVVHVLAKVRGLDDERVSLPMTPGVAVILPDPT